MPDKRPKRVVSHTPAGEKMVESNPIPGTDLYSRVDIYRRGQGKPDGPGHEHLFFTVNKQGEVTTDGGRVKPEDPKGKRG